MNALIVYDSYFGNTEKIANAIGDALQGQYKTEVIRAGEVQPEQLRGIDLLIVGTPTRQFRASEATLAFLNSLQPGALKGVRTAAFDTRIDMSKQKNAFVRLIGKFFRYAAEPTAAALVKAGGTQALPPAGFFVEESEGPLRAGEIERAAKWVKTLG